MDGVKNGWQRAYFHILNSQGGIKSIQRYEKSISYKKTFTSIFIICVLLLAILASSGIAMAHIDYDYSGLFRNYNCDDSREASIRFDMDDDTIRKVFHFGYDEWNNGDRVHLWIYARCFGTQQDSETPTHRIRIVTDYYTIYPIYFWSYKRFHYDNYHWQMFEFDMDLLYPPHSWIKVYIDDLDDWSVNNLEIGIDTTYGATPEGDPDGTLIKDFDQSFWWSNGAQITPDHENEIFGELMIKMEIVVSRKECREIPLNFDWDYYEYYPYDFIPIDDSNDYVRWRCEGITQDDIDNSMYARLYIYGYSWKTEGAPTSNNLWIQINSGPSSRFYYDPDVYWAQTRPIGHWYYYDFSPGGLLKTDENVFLIHEEGSDFERHNLGIIYFEEIDTDHSAWYYDAGQGPVGDPGLNYDQCQGELGIFLVLFQKREAVKRVGGISMWCEDHRNDECPYWDPSYNPPWQNFKHGELPVSTASIIADGLENIGWEDKLLRLDDVYDDPTIYEGYFGSEGIWGKTCGDKVDLVIFHGHGDRYGGMKLPWFDWDPNVNHKSATYSGFDDEEDIFWSIEGYVQPFDFNPNGLPVIYGKPETDNYRYMYQDFSLYSEDGFNLQADWILLLACKVLHGYGGLPRFALDKDNPYLTMLYHGTHSMMGYGTAHGGSIIELQNFANALVDNWCDDGEEMMVIEGFIKANLILPVKDFYLVDGQRVWYPQNRFVIYYHDINRYDYLHGEGTVTQDYDFTYGYEDHDIKCMVDSRGLVLNPP